MSPPPSKNRIVLAVQDEALRRRLETLLRGEDVEVEHVPDLVASDPETIDADVVVLRSKAMDQSELPELVERAGDDDAPGVVFLGDDQAEDEVRLVAAGAAAVLDPTSGSELAERLVEFAEAEREGGLHGPETGRSEAQPRLADFQSRSPAMRDFIDTVRRVAGSESTLLVTGETGVGKERLARAIHAESSRASGPFVAINCGALPESLLESELFGHERGAFTGAAEARRGHFELAQGGTIFLDEIGEVPSHLQVKLLTVLQRHEVQPLGSSKVVPVDVRVVAATNRDLDEEIREGRFREDLYFRLNVISLDIPPLRERPEDIPWLLGRFLRHFAEVHERPSVGAIEGAAMDELMRYAWPGNVRELINCVERAVLLCEGDRIEREHLPDAIRAPREAGGASAAAGSAPTAAAGSPELFESPLPEAKRRVVEDFERAYLDHHLRESDGALGEVARRAGINPRTLYEKMRRLGLRKEDY